ncbi:carbonic anhydrase [Streptomyces sp. NPDC005828]|uniref:carbonic anhydrase n=1 Tax=Streptomyces sp. NPDC005828 TaxID=3157071 RepID=UPI0033C189BF
MKRLIEGIHTFQSGVFGQQRELFESLAAGQSPSALFITCSDSRVVPSLMTQTGPGDLFMLRNAGNLVPPYGPTPGAEAAAIEYAVESLKVKDIIVCGHTRCGAMSALLDPASLERLPATRQWLIHAEATRRLVDDHYATAPETERLEACVEENVLVQIDNLRTHPSALAALARGQLKLHAWVYEIETGQVMTFDQTSGQYQPLADTARPDSAQA